MSYRDIDSSRVWLIIDDDGVIVAMAANARIAETIAMALCASVAATYSAGYRIGDTLAVFHD
jgi:hypothetical protein